jgi:hypothetical protein
VLEEIVRHTVCRQGNFFGCGDNAVAAKKRDEL